MYLFLFPIITVQMRYLFLFSILGSDKVMYQIKRQAWNWIQAWQIQSQCFRHYSTLSSYVIVYALLKSLEGRNGIFLKKSD